MLKMIYQENKVDNKEREKDEDDYLDDNNKKII